MIRDCPQRQQRIQLQQGPVTLSNGVQPRDNNGNRPPAQGRTYALTQEDAENSETAVTGTIFLNNRAAYALFDIGTIHSFVSKQFILLVKLDMKHLEIH